jgi:hypothetical protein
MWAVSPPIKEPQAIESLMLAFGKALHLACEFENKCQYVLRVFNIGEMFRTTGDAEATFAAAAAAKDHLLAQTIVGMKKISYVTADEVGVLGSPRTQLHRPRM